MPKTPSPESHPPIELIARALWVHRAHLLLCRNVAQNYYFLPGGHIEPGESAAAALRREFVEETGRGVKVGPLALTAEHAFRRKSGRFVHEVLLVFHVEHTQRRVQMGRGVIDVGSREEKIEFEWVPARALGRVDFRPRALMGALEAALKGKKPAAAWCSCRPWARR
jgi:8-oxo-dGTP diphosphatase